MELRPDNPDGNNEQVSLGSFPFEILPGHAHYFELPEDKIRVIDLAEWVEKARQSNAQNIFEGIYSQLSNDIQKHEYAQVLKKSHPEILARARDILSRNTLSAIQFINAIYERDLTPALYPPKKAPKANQPLTFTMLPEAVRESFLETSLHTNGLLTPLGRMLCRLSQAQTTLAKQP